MDTSKISGVSKKMCDHGAVHRVSYCYTALHLVHPTVPLYRNHPTSGAETERSSNVNTILWCSCSSFLRLLMLMLFNPKRNDSTPESRARVSLSPCYSLSSYNFQIVPVRTAINIAVLTSFSKVSPTVGILRATAAFLASHHDELCRS